MKLCESPLTRDLKASLRAAGIRCGSTWGEFKRGIDALETAYGLTESTPFSSIEVGVSQHGNGRMFIDVEIDGIDVKEGRR
jgi:hypothetical protein